VRPPASQRGQGEVDVALAQEFEQLRRRGAFERHAHPRPGLVEAPQNGRQIGADDVVRHAQAHLALVGGSAHGAEHLVVERDQPVGMGQKPLAVRLQRQAPVMALEQLGAEQLLQPLELLADRGLGQVEERRGSRHAAGLDHGHEGAQERSVDVAVHGGLAARLSLAYAAYKQHSI
jgi:hypothetical protein